MAGNLIFALFFGFLEKFGFLELIEILRVKSKQRLHLMALFFRFLKLVEFVDHMEFSQPLQKLYQVIRLAVPEELLIFVLNDNLHKQFAHLLPEGFHNFAVQILGKQTLILRD